MQGSEMQGVIWFQTLQWMNWAYIIICVGFFLLLSWQIVELKKILPCTLLSSLPRFVKSNLFFLFLYHLILNFFEWNSTVSVNWDSFHRLSRCTHDMSCVLIASDHGQWKIIELRPEVYNCFHAMDALLRSFVFFWMTWHDDINAVQWGTGFDFDGRYSWKSIEEDSTQCFGGFQTMCSMQINAMNLLRSTFLQVSCCKCPSVLCPGCWWNPQSRSDWVDNKGKRLKLLRYSAFFSWIIFNQKPRISLDCSLWMFVPGEPKGFLQICKVMFFFSCYSIDQFSVVFEAGVFAVVAASLISVGAAFSSDLDLRLSVWYFLFF